VLEYKEKVYGRTRISLIKLLEDWYESVVYRKLWSYNLRSYGFN
jgi:hypothetical protein